MKKALSILVLCLCTAFSVQAQTTVSPQTPIPPVTAESLAGEWCWVGGGVPELILVLEAGNDAPDSDDLTGRCVMIGILENDFDDEITLRRNYIEYDNH